MPSSQDGTLTKAKDPSGQEVNYTYDNAKRITKVETEADGKTYRNVYSYEKDRIKTVGHNTTDDLLNDVIYNFGYDELGRKTTVKIGSNTLSTNVYNRDRNGLLKEVQYGNGGKVEYQYDEFDRPYAVIHDGQPIFHHTFEYDAAGRPAYVYDINVHRKVQSEYDQCDRVMGMQIRDANENVIYRTEMDYDNQNRLVGFDDMVEDTSFKTSYTYDNDNRVTEIGFGGNDKVKYTYDNLGRVSGRIVENGTDAGKLKASYTFAAGGHGDGSTTSLVKKIDQPLIPFEYTYDNRGNIKTEKRGNLTTSYEYDALGQLIRVNDPHDNKTWLYEYDRGGNMVKRDQYAYTTADTLGDPVATRTYGYNPQWKDQLTANGSYHLTYDTSGNLKTYADWEYEWEAGRQLVKQTHNEKVVSYDYDYNGMRIRQTVSNKTSGHVYATYNYTYSGTKLAHMTVYNDDLHFFYDNQGRPAKVKYNGEMYTYLHNLQGDVVGIVDSSGALVVEYKYNVWCMLLSRTGSMAGSLGYRNPFRYRGYIYDEETWMYWVKSRYYYPELHRFINADILMGGVGNLLAHNIYFYTANNPVMCVDGTGKSFDWFVSAVENEVLYNAYWDLPLITQYKHTGFGAIGALLIINEHQDCIQAAADEFDIEKEMIEAVLFRELICVGLDDVAADLRFRITGQDCSTGIGQIFASTAIAAEKSVTGSCNKNVSEMWYALQNKCTNIRYVAMNLKSILNKNDLEIPKTEDSSKYSTNFLAFARYNAKSLGEKAKTYATAVEKYYNAFKSLRR